MSTLQYRGAALANNTDLVYQDYMATLKSGDMTTAAIDSAINSGLSGYATTAYVDQQDAFNATKAYVDAGDAQRIKLTQQNIANGVAPLDANGRISPLRINLPPTQRWFKGPWTPSAYLSSQVDLTAETTLYPAITVADPGYSYKLVVFGSMDARSNLDAEYPIVNVRANDANAGEIVAQGVGPSDAGESAAPTVGENFLVDSASGLVAADWHATQILGTGGQYNVSGGQAVWADSGSSPSTWRYRRLTAADAVTQTDYQKVRLVIGSIAGESTFGGGDQYVVAAGRMSTDEATWIGLLLGNGYAQFAYAAGGNLTFLGSKITADTSAGTAFDVLLGTGSNLRQLVAYRNNVSIGSTVDSGAVTGLGAAFRGWGFLGHADSWGFPVFISQTTPPDIAALLIGDAPPSFGSMTIVPRTPASMSVRTGATQLFVRGTRSGTTSTASFTAYAPRLNVWVIPA